MNANFKEGYNLCMKHIDQLIRDGDLLAEKASFGHATFLYFTAMEEAVKAYYYAGIHVNLFQYDEVKKDICDHMLKTGSFLVTIGIDLLSEGKISVPDIRSREELIQKWTKAVKGIRDTRNQREKFLYVDLIDDKWNYPLECNKKDVDEWRVLVVKYTEYVKKTAETFFNIPLETRKEMPKIIEYINRWIQQNAVSFSEEMLKRKIITKEEYNKLKATLELVS
jgi:AbiV family abortive infection protein